MQTIGFDNEKYLSEQSEAIINRAEQFGNKLYLEFGGKISNDLHAARVLPGFDPDGKLIWKKGGVHEGLAISHNEDLVAIEGGKGVEIYELKTGSHVRSLYCDERAIRIRFTQDDSKI